MNLNKVEIAGGLTRDPELRFTPGGMAVMELTVALNGTRYDSGSRQQVVTTTYVAVQAFGSLAEEAAESGLRQGDAVYVLGSLDQTEFEKRDGTKEKKTRVTAGLITATRRRHTQSSTGPRPDPHTAQQSQDPWAP